MTSTASFGTVLAEANKLIANNQINEAIALLQQNVEREPRFYEGHLLLSKCWYQTNHIKQAVLVCQQAEQVDPLLQEFHSIQQYMQNNAMANVQNTAQSMLASIPNHPRAIFTLAHIAQKNGFLSQAIALLKQGIQASPANITLQGMIIGMQEAIGEYTGAIDSAKTLVTLSNAVNANDLPQHYLRLLNLMLRLGQYTEANVVCKQADALASKTSVFCAQLALIRAHIQRITGNKEACISSLRASLTHDAKCADAWWALTDLKTYTFSGDDTARIKTLITRTDVSSAAKCKAAFALAKSLEQQGDYAASMNTYHHANRLHAPQVSDPTHFEQEFAMRSKVFNQMSLRTQASIDKNLPTPIFIVGLPRSGSTLLEQILSSHSQIQGTLEQATLGAIERQANELCRLKYNKGLLSSLELLSSSELSDLGAAYIKKGGLFRHNHAPFFIDKQPFNFRQVGFIHKILPHAVIIDIRRNPLDCGLSLYKQYFPSGVDFSYQLGHIGRFYNAYTALMTHWQQTIPNKVLSIQYENLVQEPELVVKQIMTHLHLHYEAQCLQFHQNTRNVHTASSEQVRQPLNLKGIGSWQRYDNELGELKLALGEDTLKHSLPFMLPR
ncbi:MAG: sulfotransferase [Glaciecola sp.]